jgi:hypothetical protein
MRDGGLERFGIKGTKQPASRAIRAVKAETYGSHVVADCDRHKAIVLALVVFGA